MRTREFFHLIFGQKTYYTSTKLIRELGLDWYQWNQFKNPIYEHQFYVTGLLKSIK